MVRFAAAALWLCLCSERTFAFQSSVKEKIVNGAVSFESRLYVASSLSEEPFSDNFRGNLNLQATMSNITASYVEAMSMEADAEEKAVQKQLERRALASQKLKSQVFSLGGILRCEFALSNPIGISLAQVDSGRKISDVDLDLDDLKLESVPVGEVEGVARQRMDWPTVAGRVDAEFNGLLVSSVVQGSAAWSLGVRAGDVLSSVSATVGEKLWPTSTLDGIQSALRSRRLTSPSISMEFRRMSTAARQMGSRYELTLKRPLGMEVQETKDGYVVVTAFSDSASNLVRHAVRPGDRVIAVDSTFGDSMWPVTTVEGLSSACMSRLPGVPVTLQFERPRESMQGLMDNRVSQREVAETAFEARKGAVAAVQENSVAKKQPVDKKALLQRCRDVLERYFVRADNNALAGFKDKYAVPAIVADKVVDALSSAEVSIDGVTLSMIMRAYLSCKRPDDALRVFEAAVGFRADASCLPCDTNTSVGCEGLLPNESALNLYTGTALLQAHAMKGDLYSVSRVLASLEGRAGVLVNGLESAPWPFTGAYGSIQPDTRCYNVAISAGAKAGGEEALEMALALFETMNNKAKPNGSIRKPERDVVSYNTIINALSSAGRSVDAFRVFDQMKQSKVRPDKFTYTPLIKACLSDGDIEELLYDMRENNVKGDTVTYNNLVGSLCEKRRWTDALRLVTEMETHGVPPDSGTYGILMSAMLKAGKAKACLTLFESAFASSKTSQLTENVYLYTTAITAASVLGDYNRAIEFVARMTAKGVKPNLKTLTSVVGACLAAGQCDLAVQVYQNIEKPDAYAMCQGVEALSRSGDFAGAVEILRSQRSRKARVMSGKQLMKSYQILIVGALKARKYGMAKDAFTDMMQMGNIPNKVMLQEMSYALGYGEMRGVVSFTIEQEEEEIEAFRFLLFVLDSLHKRKLAVDGHLYSVVLFLGKKLGGKAQAVASLISRLKVPNGDGQRISSPFSDRPAVSEVAIPSWLKLFDKFEDYDVGALESNDVLPTVLVQVAGRDVWRLNRAEKEVESAANVKSKKAQLLAKATTRL